MSKSCMEFFLFQTNSCLGTPKMLACFLNWKLHKHLTLISESCHSLCTPESWIKACMSPSGAMHGCAPVQSSMSSLPSNLSHCYASLSLISCRHRFPSTSMDSPTSSIMEIIEPHESLINDIFMTGQPRLWWMFAVKDGRHELVTVDVLHLMPWWSDLAQSLWTLTSSQDN